MFHQMFGRLFETFGSGGARAARRSGKNPPCWRSCVSRTAQCLRISWGRRRTPSQSWAARRSPIPARASSTEIWVSAQAAPRAPSERPSALHRPIPIHVRVALYPIPAYLHYLIPSANTPGSIHHGKAESQSIQSCARGARQRDYQAVRDRGLHPTRASRRGIESVNSKNQAHRGQYQATQDARRQVHCSH
jgi:hypothetical protein